MSRKVLVLLGILGVAVGGFAFYRYWTSPEQVAARLRASVDAEAERIRSALPDAVDSGPGVERVDPSSIFPKLVLSRTGTRVDLDAGEGRTLAWHKLERYVETNEVDGRQAADGLLGSMKIGPSDDPSRGSRTDVLQSTDGYGASRPIERRAFVQMSAAAVERDSAGAETLEAREVVGPAIDLVSEADSRWRLLWMRDGGEALHWRRTATMLDLRLRGAVPADALPRLRIGGDDGVPAFTASDDGAVASIPLARVASIKAIGVRCKIRVAVDAETARRTLTIELAAAKVR